MLNAAVTRALVSSARIPLRSLGPEACGWRERRPCDKIPPIVNTMTYFPQVEEAIRSEFPGPFHEMKACSGRAGSRSTSPGREHAKLRSVARRGRADRAVSSKPIRWMK
jgi:hypothetical protein